MSEKEGGVEITLEAAEKGSRLVAEHTSDPHLMAKPNWAGQLAARVYRSMSLCAGCEKDHPTERGPY